MEALEEPIDSKDKPEPQKKVISRPKKTKKLPDYKTIKEDLKAPNEGDSV